MVSLVCMMMLVVALATLDLGWIITKDILTPPILLLDLDELLEIFGFFLLILIGVELLETIKAYLRDNIIHVEIVLEVAVIAVARKVIVLDLSKYATSTPKLGRVRRPRNRVNSSRRPDACGSINSRRPSQLRAEARGSAHML